MQDYTLQNRLPILELPSTTMQCRDFFSKSYLLLRYTAVQKATKSQELYSLVFKQILYYAIQSLLEKQEKNSVGYLACAKYQSKKHKFSFKLQHSHYSSKEIKPTLYRNNKRSHK
ncbi:hypothetical protein H9Q08_17130 [Chryseobacterium sp. PS-8]|uniref:Uncharacterized protein n=1 Tax=Chryseobacterium indicum TaxID=2766954 RepID=A0ABS9CCC1_9FLAO|nr:hypothetical protein [Chryseobacterium sp. PS-8]MCF2221011.1 hypothetical protein [Chryseobacterium sp. PS-8]